MRIEAAVSPVQQQRGPPQLLDGTMIAKGPEPRLDRQIRRQDLRLNRRVHGVGPWRFLMDREEIRHCQRRVFADELGDDPQVRLGRPSIQAELAVHLRRREFTVRQLLGSRNEKFPSGSRLHQTPQGLIGCSGRCWAAGRRRNPLFLGRNHVFHPLPIQGVCQIKTYFHHFSPLTRCTLAAPQQHNQFTTA